VSRLFAFTPGEEQQIAMPAKPLRVLFVDDDEDDYILMRGLLEEKLGEETQVRWEISFEEALGILRENCMDIAFVDWRLSYFSGLELVRKAVAEGCQTTLVIVTGMLFPSLEEEAKKAGAHYCLSKNDLMGPSSGDILAKIISERGLA
jgi:CheY-like chemotaxis protein